MAVPARRTGKTRKNTRSQHISLEAANLSVCNNCGAKIKPHRVCPECGYYKGRKVKEVPVSAE